MPIGRLEQVVREQSPEWNRENRYYRNNHIQAEESETLYVIIKLLLYHIFDKENGMIVELRKKKIAKKKW